MANYYDYLEYWKDISFEKDSFNEIDNVVLAEASYINFDELLEMKDKTISLKEARDKYFEFHTRDQIKTKITHIAQAPLLLDYLAISKRYENLKLGYYVDILDEKTTSQFSAITFEFEDMIYIGFRGTDDTVVGWKENFYSSFLNSTSSQKHAVSYTNKIIEIYKGKKEIHIGGHSKGGNLAVFSATFCKEEYQKFITRIWNNDGPGFPDIVLEKEKYKIIKEKIYRIIPQSSIIGLLMKNDVNPQIVKSDKRLLLQHTMDTWQVEENKFIKELSLTNESFFIQQSLSTWLEKIDDKDRKRVIDCVFISIENAGYKTFTQMYEDGIGAIKKIKKQTQKLEKEDRDMIMELLNNLIQVSKNTIKDSILKKLSSIKF